MLEKASLVKVTTLVGLCVALLYTLDVAFNHMFDASKDEVARVPSPDGKVDAVLVESNGGATTSFGYDVYIVRAGARVSGNSAAWLYDALRSDHAYGVNMKWDSPNRLVLEYLQARNVKLSSPHPRIDGRSFEIAIRPGTLDSGAPPGGMLYNLPIQK